MTMALTNARAIITDAYTTMVIADDADAADVINLAEVLLQEEHSDGMLSEVRVAEAEAGVMVDCY